MTISDILTGRGEWMSSMATSGLVDRFDVWTFNRQSCIAQNVRPEDAKFLTLAPRIARNADILMQGFHAQTSAVKLHEAMKQLELDLARVRGLL